MSKEQEENFGNTIAGSRWFKGEPNIKRSEVKTYKEAWLCPMDDCEGEMEPNGFVWSCLPPGIHHTCNKCGFTAALSGENYPRTVYEEVEQ